MQVITPDLIRGKRVLVRIDMDVTLEDKKVTEDFRLMAGLPTINMCLEHASEVTLMGHIGRPGGKEDPALSVEPVHDWFAVNGYQNYLSTSKLRILENLRFEPGEEECSLDYAKDLAEYGDFFINEAFASHNKSASTTVLPTLMPHAAGLRFDAEVKKLLEVRDNPKKPLIAILGGAKVEDKLPVIDVMSKVADYVLVGGKLAVELKEKPEIAASLAQNVRVAQLNPDGLDITVDAVHQWWPLIHQAKMVVWNGPLGKVEDEKNSNTLGVAQAIIQSGAESVVGGGDSIAFFDKYNLMDKFTFVSTGGGAMLKLLSSGTLPTIEALS
jgi:phosphoglycerate kinase